MEQNNVSYGYSNDYEPVLCPGKEIAIMICGIHAIVWAAFAGVFGIFPFYGFIFWLIYGMISLGGIIPSFILYNDVKKIATSIGNKGNIGKKLATISIIVLVASFVISIIITVLAVLFFGGIAFLGAASSY